MPLANDTATIGYLCVGHIVAEKMTAFETKLAEGIATMLSTHIEINQIKERTKLLANAEIKALQAQIDQSAFFIQCPKYDQLLLQRTASDSKKTYQLSG